MDENAHDDYSGACSGRLVVSTFSNLSKELIAETFLSTVCMCSPLRDGHMCFVLTPSLTPASSILVCSSMEVSVSHASADLGATERRSH